MTDFELFLMKKGYLPWRFDCKSMKYVGGKFLISTMSNLDYRYIHKSDRNLLDKIDAGKIIDKDITREDRKGVIVFGLHEHNKPATLISPRPRIQVKRSVDAPGGTQIKNFNEMFDDSMNLVFSKHTNEEIFKAMYDKEVIFRFDLTQQ